MDGQAWWLLRRAGQYLERCPNACSCDKWGENICRYWNFLRVAGVRRGPGFASSEPPSLQPQDCFCSSLNVALVGNVPPPGLGSMPHRVSLRLQGASIQVPRPQVAREGPFTHSCLAGSQETPWGSIFFGSPEPSLSSGPFYSPTLSPCPE